VGLDRAGADDRLLGDLLVAEPLEQQKHHFPLPLGEGFVALSAGEGRGLALLEVAV